MHVLFKSIFFYFYKFYVMEHLIYFAFNNNTRDDKFEHIQEYFKKDTPLLNIYNFYCFF